MASAGKAPKSANFDVWRPPYIFGAALLLRVVLLIWGNVQDARSPVKYTDIDYNVFTDASRFLAAGYSPYERATYRYTPVLAWMLIPTAWTSVPLAFSFGKIIFALSDIVAGWLILSILKSQGMDSRKALQYASIWLLNPMVANISTRGSSEGLLAVIVLAMLRTTLEKRLVLAGCLLGLAVHLKIYPFMYGSAIFWWLSETSPRRKQAGPGTLRWRGFELINGNQILFVASSMILFLALNVAMYNFYGYPFLYNTYLYHLTRLDHRHNYSPYNVLLYLKSSPSAAPRLGVESLAFVPQLTLSALAIPLALAKKDLASCMLVQTTAFVAFNKVCTAQYFMWFMVFLPFYLPQSSVIGQPLKGITLLAAWILPQAWWLHQAFALEHLQQSTFFPGLYSASLLLFVVNGVMLGVFIDDVASVGAK